MRVVAILVTSLLLATIGPAAVVAAPSADQATPAQRRIDAAAKVFDASVSALKVGKGSVADAAAWSVRWLTAQREQPLKGAKLKAALADHLARMQDLDATTRNLVDAGQLSSVEKLASAYFVAEAELWVARGK